MNSLRPEMPQNTPALKPIEVALLGFGHARATENPQNPWFTYGEFTDAIKQSAPKPKRPEPKRLRADTYAYACTSGPLLEAGHLLRKDHRRKITFCVTPEAKPVLYSNTAGYVLEKGMMLPPLLRTQQAVAALRNDKDFAPYLVEASYTRQIENPKETMLPRLVLLGFAQHRAQQEDPWFRYQDVQDAPRDPAQLPLHYNTTRQSLGDLASQGLLEKEGRYRDERLDSPYEYWFSTNATSQTAFFETLSTEMLKNNRRGGRNLAQLLVLPQTVEYVRNDGAFASHLVETISAPLTDTAT